MEGSFRRGIDRPPRPTFLSWWRGGLIPSFLVARLLPFRSRALSLHIYIYLYRSRLKGKLKPPGTPLGHLRVSILAWRKIARPVDVTTGVPLHFGGLVVARCLGLSFSLSFPFSLDQYLYLWLCIYIYIHIHNRKKYISHLIRDGRSVRSLEFL